MKLSSNGKCAHCNSSEIEHYGSNIGGLHSYFKCRRCNKFTEYHLSTKNYLIISIATVLLMIFIIGITFTLMETNSLLALIFFLASILLSATFIYKYRWSGMETIALPFLPDASWIVRSPKRKIRLIVAAILVAVVLIIHVGFIILVIIRNWKT